MSLMGDVAIALAIAIGLVGIVLPILPGTVVILAAVVVWAALEGGAIAWTACAIAVGALVAAQVLKYAVPGRRLRISGVPPTTLVIAAALAVVGFFVIPVVGLVIGFVVGVYAAEAARLGDLQRAWQTTRSALSAVGLSILIELAGGLAAAAVWAAAVVATAQ
jgi:uncharacterized protein YqgC (DUF456 family)